MRKAVFLLAAIAIIAAPAAASAKHRRHHHRAPVVAAVVDTNEAGWRLFWTGADAFFLLPWRTVFVGPAPIVSRY
jgi:hypothetical protein